MTAGHASSSVQQALNDQDLRDKVLIGVAGLAVAAALGIAYQRRQNEEA
jgi:glutamate synthase domain-containing protein 2